MNEIEARDISQSGKFIKYENLKDIEKGRNLGRAKGYLEAREKARGLEEALEEFIGAIKTDRHITNKWFCYKKGIETLSRYREEI